MRKTQGTNVARAAAVAASLSPLSGVFSFARETPKPQKSKPEYIQATAEGTSTQPGRIVSVTMIINEYSTADDQKVLVEAFEQKKNEGLNHAPDKMKAKGRVAITGTLGYDLNYIRQFQMPDGSRTLVPVNSMSDILPMCRGTPVERLLRYHNLGEPLPPGTGHAEVLVGMCGDHRKDLKPWICVCSSRRGRQSQG